MQGSFEIVPSSAQNGIMARSNLFAILGIILCGFIAWYYQARSNRENLELKSAIQTEGASTATPVGTADGNRRSPDAADTKKKSETRVEIQNEIQNLTQQMNGARASLDTKRQKLETLMSGQSSEITQLENPQGSGVEDLDTEQDVVQIQQLNDRLNDLNAEEVLLMAGGDSVGVEGTQATMVVRDQLDNQIRVLDDAIKETELQIQEWQNNYGYVNEQEENLARLQSQLESQNQEMEDLRTQRGNLFNDALQNTQTEQTLKEQRLSEIMNSKQSLYQEIERLRAQVSQRQSGTYEDRLSQLGQEDEIMFLRESYEEERRDYQVLEEEKKRLESELLAL